MSFPGKQLPKKKKAKVVSEPDSSETNPEQSKSTPQEDHDVPDETEVEKTTRKSTRTSVIVRQAERDAIRAALQATMKVDHHYFRLLIYRILHFSLKILIFPFVFLLMMDS